MNKKILIIDDNSSIHDDFKKILTYSNDSSYEYDKIENELFGEELQNNKNNLDLNYELYYASQGLEAVEKVQKASEKNEPYALAFVDIRMPPGIDGIETIKKIWEIDPNIEIVVCSAYSDYSWEDIIEKLGINDKLLFLKKPFDSVEVKQMALSLVTKWDLHRKSKTYVDNLEKEVSKRTKQLKSMVQELISNRDKMKREFFIREKTEISLEQEKNIFITAFNSLNKAFIILDHNLNVFFINSIAEEVLNTKNDDLLYKNLSDIYNIIEEENPSLELKFNNSFLTYLLEKNKLNLILKHKEIKSFIKIQISLSKLEINNNSSFIILIKINDFKNENKQNLAKEFKNIWGSIIGNKNNKEYNKNDNILKKQIKKTNNKVIYIVEEDLVVKNTLKSLFSSLNYEINFIEYKDLDNQNFSKDSKESIIILDSNLFNHINDFDFLKEIKELNSNSKFVLLTSIHNKNLIYNYKNYYFDDIITKPFEISSIEKVLI
ncbi:MAG: response regulator [Candidatus Sericytochromatia bacterium]